MNPVLKWILRGLGILIISLVCIFISEKILSNIEVDEKKYDEPKDIALYLMSNGVHTDIVMPVHSIMVNWEQYFSFQNTLSKDTTYQYVGIGWGDKGFYLETPTWADLKFSVAFKAVTGLGNSAIHATYFSNAPQEGAQCKKFMVSKSQYQQLIAYIISSLDLDKNGKSINVPTEAEYGQSDAFYEAKGSYSMFHTCNSWTNNALKSGGMKAVVWTAFDKPLIKLYSK